MVEATLIIGSLICSTVFGHFLTVIFVKKLIKESKTISQPTKDRHLRSIGSRSFTSELIRISNRLAKNLRILIKAIVIFLIEVFEFSFQIVMLVLWPLKMVIAYFQVMNMN